MKHGEAKREASMNRIMYLLITGLMLALSNPSVASIQCGADLVEEGDSVMHLVEACGEPDIGDLDLVIELGYGEVTYNFGPREFMVRVEILDGKVERTETLGYGFVEGADEPVEDL